MTTQTLAQRILDELIRQDSGYVGNASDDLSIVIIDGSFDLVKLAEAVDPVQIKQLEWRTFCATSGNCSAKAFGDEYVVQNEGDRWNMYLPHQDEWCSIHPTLDEAKSAAQANFEARIREALI